jgi:hypothetical protein
MFGEGGRFVSRKMLKTLLSGEGPFAIQPGSGVSDLVKLLGKQSIRDPDVIVGGLPSTRRRGVWYRALCVVEVPVDVQVPAGDPLGGTFHITSTSMNLIFRYRADAGVVWGVGVYHSAGGFRRSVGLLSPAADLAGAKQLLGRPKAVLPYTPVLKRYYWEAAGLVYLAEFFSKPFRDLTRTFDKGHQFRLDVFASGHAPRGFIDRLFVDPDAWTASRQSRRTS